MHTLFPWRLSGLVGLFLLILPALLSPAAWASKVALVVGNANYVDKPLQNPVNDAELMHKTLRGLGFEVTLVRNADRKVFLSALRGFETKARGAEMALFYFAGHGTQVGGSNYLLPVGAGIKTESDVVDEAVDASSVLRRIEESRARVGLVILDACRDNPYAGASRSSSRGLSRMSAPTGSIIAYSTSPGQTADDGRGKNGLYTEQLVKHLSTPELDLREVFDRTAKSVEHLSGGKQRPREDVALRDRVYLGAEVPIRSSEPISSSLLEQTHPVSTDVSATQASSSEIGVGDSELKAVELEAWAIAKKRDTDVAYQTYIDLFPNGKYLSAAKISLKGLGGGDLSSGSKNKPKIPESILPWLGAYELHYPGNWATSSQKLELKIEYNNAGLKGIYSWFNDGGGFVELKEFTVLKDVAVGLAHFHSDHWLCVAINKNNNKLIWVTEGFAFFGESRVREMCEQIKGGNKTYFNEDWLVVRKTQD